MSQVYPTSDLLLPNEVPLMLFSYIEAMVGSIVIVFKEEEGPSPISFTAEICAVDTL